MAYQAIFLFLELIRNKGVVIIINAAGKVGFCEQNARRKLLSDKIINDYSRYFYFFTTQ
jgi:hypothetical protein